MSPSLRTFARLLVLAFATRGVAQVPSESEDTTSSALEGVAAEERGVGDATEADSRDTSSDEADADEAAEEDADDYGYGATTEPDFGATALVWVDDDPAAPRDDARSTVTRAQLDERQPRSAPDALRFEPGVAIQQTAHGQASPYVRGLTGQQVVHLFDGIRLNNGLYRQGPNQYFFTVDQQTLARLDVIRGSSSVRWGSDALGGAVLATPIRPRLDHARDGVSARPRVFFRYGSADREIGGRAQLELQLGRDTGLLVGGGYRDVDLLESGGVVRHRDRVDTPVTRGDVAPWVPRFVEEPTHPNDPSKWRTQLGTGFREATYDARLEHRLRRTLRLVAATYGYRQMDAPRTDQCPSPEAPIDECLQIDRQFRTLSYVALRGDAGPMRDVDLVLSHQRHLERRVRDRPRSAIRFRWQDVVDTLGFTFRAATAPKPIGEHVSFRVRYGLDAFRDDVHRSNGERTFTDIDVTTPLSRGQYLDGSRYLTGGLFAELEARAWDWLVMRGGARLAVVDASAPGDAESGTSAIDRTFVAPVARAGLAAKVRPGWSIALNVDQGFRAPNLDDLTARQQVGPGFQFENASLEPERSLTTELGVMGETEHVRLDLWTFATRIEDGIQRVVREIADCPPGTPECGGSRDPFQLVNADEASRLFGAEGGLTVYLPADVTLRSTFSYAWGDGPSLGDRGATPPGTRVPLSRVPPPQGTFEGRWRHAGTGLWVGAALRWAAPQGRLAVADASDPRIPRGGTPGYAVVDLRAGWTYRGWLAFGLVAENLGDAAYRVHGSSIQGPGRSVVAWMRLGL
ncbi:MAG: TonB-dependent receptor [Sandaracinus sp.]|nr:TonB-dependent receptor [Sandaracinus sp.]